MHFNCCAHMVGFPWPGHIYIVSTGDFDPTILKESCCIMGNVTPGQSIHLRMYGTE